MSVAYAALRREQEGAPTAKTTPADAFKAAVRIFIRDPRLDMGTLAGELGVSKATVYRWTGSREKLLAEILSFLSDDRIDAALRETSELGGVERILAFYRSYVGAIVSFEPLKRLINNETRLAFRLLTTRGGIVQQRVVDRVTELIEQESASGALKLRAPAASLAYAATRMTEGFIYNDPVADIDPDVEAAVEIVRLLLD